MGKKGSASFFGWLSVKGTFQKKVEQRIGATGQLGNTLLQIDKPEQ